MARMGEKRNAYNIFVEKSEGKIWLGRPKHRQNSEKIGHESVGWIHKGQDVDLLWTWEWTFVFHDKKVGNLLSRWATASFSRWTTFHVVYFSTLCIYFPVHHNLSNTYRSKVLFRVVRGLKKNWLNPLKPKLIQILINNPVRTSKRTPLFTIITINLLMLFKKIIPAYSSNHTKPRITKSIITDW
jgi:hypothetical protein